LKLVPNLFYSYPKFIFDVAQSFLLSIDPSSEAFCMTLTHQNILHRVTGWQL
jgi:hypothetical protein